MQPNFIIQFLQNHKISTHALASGLLFLVGAYAAVPSFHALVNNIASAHPAIDEWGTALIGLFMLYSNSKKSA